MIRLFPGRSLSCGARIEIVNLSVRLSVDSISMQSHGRMVVHVSQFPKTHEVPTPFGLHRSAQASRIHKFRVLVR